MRIVNSMMLITIFSLSGLCQIQPERVIELNYPKELKIDFSYLDHSSNYFISEIKENILEFKYLGLSISVMDLYSMTAYHEQVLRFSLIQNKIVESSELKRYEFLQSGLTHNHNSVIVNDVTIALEQSDYLEEIECYDSGPRLYNRFCNLSSKLSHATLSPNQQFIGGALHYAADTGGSRSSSNYRWDTAALWDAANGNILYNEFPNFNQINGIDSDEIIDLQFTSDSQFMIFRSVDYSYRPRALLVNTNTFSKWDADRDVVFSQDNRFFITERNGVPTLVEAQNNRNLQTFDIGNSVMHSVTFSQNEKQVFIFTGVDDIYNAFDYVNGEYVATGKEKIFIFKSQLPTSNVNDWALNK